MKKKMCIINKGYLWIITGSLLLVLAFVICLYNIFIQNIADNYTKQTISQIKFNEEPIKEDEKYIPDYIINPEMDMPEQTIDGSKYIGVIDIPKLELYLPVITSCSNASLKKAPCRYKGSVYKDDMIIAGHNYRMHFGKLSKLHYGDEISFKDIDGNVFKYEVVEIETLKDTDLDLMVGGDWDLTLFTCNYSGGARVTVRCKRASL